MGLAGAWPRCFAEECFVEECFVEEMRRGAESDSGSLMDGRKEILLLLPAKGGKLLLLVMKSLMMGHRTELFESEFFHKGEFFPAIEAFHKGFTVYPVYRQG